MDIKKQILKKFMYNKSMKYNEIREDMPSNKFNYHLKSLIINGIIEQKGDKYSISSKGMQYIGSLDGKQLEEKRKPIICVFVLAYKNGKILVNERKKQPFMDYIGIPGGKLDFASTMINQAAEELLEETGIKAKKLELKLVTNYRTLDKSKNEFSHHVIGFFYLATSLSGILKEIDREGKNSFMTIKQVQKLKRYPDLDFDINAIINNKTIVFQEAIRYIENGEFYGIDFLD